MGHSLIVVSPDLHIGGLTSNGLSWEVAGKEETIGGISREFYHRVWRHYQSPDAWKWEKMDDYGNRGQGSPAFDGDRRTMWIFEPRVAEEILESWIKENDLQVIREERLDREKGVLMKSGKITAITCLSGNRYEGKVFLDCTYEGDLMAAAGVGYSVGGEINAFHGDALKGHEVQVANPDDLMNQIDPSKISRNQTRGLFESNGNHPLIEYAELDSVGRTFPFRLCLTQIDDNHVPFTRPDGYDPHVYEYLLPFLFSNSYLDILPFSPIPNAKSVTVNLDPFGVCKLDLNNSYADESYESRTNILEALKRYQKGIFYFLCNDLRVPEDLRQRMSLWGFAADEFVEYENWPPQLCLGESRRMISEVVITEDDLFGLRKAYKPIGLGSSPMVSHQHQRKVFGYENDHFRVSVQGNFRSQAIEPYTISYDAIVPKENECKNLLVPVCLSASRLAYGSIRMEPVLMVLGQSAATAASLAIEDESSVQNVDYKELRERLLRDGQILEFQKSNRVVHGIGRRVSKLGGVVVDGKELILEGEWTLSSSLRPFVGSSYYHDGNGGKGLSSATFPFAAPSDGVHEIKASYSAFGNRAGNIRYEVEHEGGTAKVLIDQRKPHRGSDLWSSLGTFSFQKGKRYSVTLYNENTEGYVIADAIQVIGLNP